MRGLSAHSQSGARSGLGVHGPLVRPAADPTRAESARDYQKNRQGHQELHRQAAGGLAGQGFTQTLDTPENLVEAGIKYICDWPIDDEPVEIKTAKGPLLTLPYSIELNDIALMIVQHQAPQELYTRCMDYFERLYAESASRAKIMSIAVHPYISGTPFRIKYLEQVLAALKKKRGVVFWTGEEIMNWYRSARRQ